MAPQLEKLTITPTRVVSKREREEVALTCVDNMLETLRELKRMTTTVK